MTNQVVQIGALDFFFLKSYLVNYYFNVECYLHVAHAKDMQIARNFTKNLEFFNTCTN